MNTFLNVKKTDRGYDNDQSVIFPVSVSSHILCCYEVCFCCSFLLIRFSVHIQLKFLFQKAALTILFPMLLVAVIVSSSSMKC